MGCNRLKIKVVGLYSFVHAVVDFSCAFILLGILTKFQIFSYNIAMISVILYNFLAFVLQFPVGMIADKWNKNRYISIIGCSLVIIGLLLSLFTTNWLALLSVLFFGLGNAFFHIGGGVDVLNISEGKASLPGIYVSTGALGLFLGGYLEYSILSLSFVFSLLMLSIILLLLLNEFVDLPNNLSFEWKKPKINGKLVLLFFFLAVCLRSFTGFAVSFDWKSGFWIGLLSTCCVVGGKMLGGIIGDKLGWGKVSNLSLLVVSVLFIFAPTNMFCGLLSLLLFNMTMPLTLTALSNTFPNSKGMMFGLTTVALFVGYIIEMLISSFIDNISGGLVLFVCGVLSLVVMYLGFKYYKRS